MRVGSFIKRGGQLWMVTGLPADGVIVESPDGEILKITKEQAMASAHKPRRKPPASKPVPEVGVVTQKHLLIAAVVQTIIAIIGSIYGAHVLDERRAAPSPPPIVDPIDIPPAPAPKPDVAKVPKGALLVVVEETAERDKHTYLATLQKDVPFWDGLAGRGYKYGFTDAEMAQIKPYQSKWQSVGLPCLLAIMPDGTVPLAIACPQTTSEINKYLEQ